MIVTVKDIIKLCESSYPIYDILIEDAGMMGEYEIMDDLSKEKEKIKDLVEEMNREFYGNSSFDLITPYIWLQGKEDNGGIKAFVSCMDKVKQSKLKEIEKIQKDVDCCDFIKKHYLLKQFGGNNDSN